MVKDFFIGMGIIIFGTLVGSVGALLFKIASRKMNKNIFQFLKNPTFYGGATLHGLSALLLVYALKFGDLSTLYPLVSLAYIWTILLSLWFLKEKINSYKWIGMFLIIVGIIFISIGA
jgi:uncharacterized membrane protein